MLDGAGVTRLSHPAALATTQAARAKFQGAAIADQEVALLDHG